MDDDAAKRFRLSIRLEASYRALQDRWFRQAQRAGCGLGWSWQVDSQLGVSWVMRVPPVIILISRWEFSMNQTIQPWRYPHDYGNPQVSDVSAAPTTTALLFLGTPPFLIVDWKPLSYPKDPKGSIHSPVSRTKKDSQFLSWSRFFFPK